MRGKISPEDRRRRVADDVRRTAGYMEAVVEQARRLDMAVPGAIVVCVDTWRGCYHALDRRAGESRPD
jgi:hypothetical protein